MTSTALTRNGLMARLDEMGIATTTLEHPAVHTVAESSAIEIVLPGAHTKNLFLKAESGALLLIVAQSATKVDLKALGKALGCGRLSFGKPELLLETLGVTPGSVNAFAIANDHEKRVRVILDQDLAKSGSINCHPMENTATTNIALDDLLRFIRETGHEPQFMVLTSP